MELSLWDTAGQEECVHSGSDFLCLFADVVEFGLAPLLSQF